LKAQVIINQKNGEILCTEGIFRGNNSSEKMPPYGKGSGHDFKLYIRSRVRIKKEVKCLADKGYQGIQNYHSFSQTPKKKPRKDKLSSLDKKMNRELARAASFYRKCICTLKKISDFTRAVSEQKKTIWTKI
jgi:endo-beta-N-acetylglucosaminidase D